MMKKFFKALGVAVMAMAIAFTSIPAIPVQAQDIGLPPAGFRSAGRYPAGKVENYYYYSTETRSNRKLVVYTPPGYNKNDTSKKYPVVYSIHGIDNTPESIFRAWGADANLVADNLIGSGQIEPVIIVAWDNNNINCHNELVNNVLPYVERTFPVIKDADHRAVYGYSMGGGYAFAEVMGNLDTFHHLSPTSALPMNHPSDDAMFKKGSADVKSKLKTLVLSCGTIDWCGFYPANKATHDYCVRYNIPHYWLSVQGGNHDSEVWSPAMYYLLKYAFPKGSSSQTPSQPQPTQTPDSGTVNTANTMQCENMALSGTYAGKISNPFSGAVFYTNNDTASYTQQFGYDTHDFTLRGCSSNNNTAAVDLKIGGEKKGTFYFRGTTPTDVTLKNIKHVTGNVKIELTVTTDDNTWDVYCDYLKIGSATTQESTQAPTQQPTQAPTQAPTKEPATEEPVVSGKLDASYSINSWGGGYQVNFKITNNSASTVNGWTLTVKKSDVKISSSWNVTVKESGDSYIITPISWNSSIAPKGSVEFGILGEGSIGNTISCSVK